MNSKKFREELIKIMPGYKWTIHRKNIYAEAGFLRATGIQTSGYNRLSTLHVARREREHGVAYEVKSAGFGKSAPWLHTCEMPTLAQALRELQSYYESMANKYANHGRDLKTARVKKGDIRG